VAYIIICLIFPGKTENKEALDSQLPSIEHIICFKNESKFARRKLENCYDIDYPKIRHTFINDNSSDDTGDIITRFARSGCRVVHNQTDKGKNQSQITAVKNSQSDLLLFTDANVFLNPNAIKKLLQGFDDLVVGVCGNVTIKTETMKSEFSGRYWQLEKRIKRFQSRFGCVIGFDGGFYCVKRENYNIKRENELSDFETAFLIFEQGKKTRYMATAMATEIEKRSLKSSFKARVRASNRVLWSYRRIFRYADKLSQAVWINFFFHKLLRYGFIMSFVIFLPMMLISIYEFMPFLLLILFIPYIHRIIIESVALCVGGVVAVTGKEYTSWSDKKI
jgi:cellulose synthase/poly-beta-1,6-N-acetylglucosamine synthase-like glycosyltransferase